MKKTSQKEQLSHIIQEMGESNFFARESNLYRFIIEAAEKPLIKHVLQKTEGNQLAAARILGINRNTLRSKIKKLGIKMK